MPRIRRYVMTPARRAALRKAQLASARKRRRRSSRSQKEVTLYHYTTAQNAQRIERTGRFKTQGYFRRHKFRGAPRARNQVYFLKRRSRPYQNAVGEAFRNAPLGLVTVKVPTKYIKSDPNDKTWRPQYQQTWGKKFPRSYMVNKKDLYGRRITAYYA